MTTSEYKTLCDVYKNIVPFVWSHWIDKSMSYSEAESFCLDSIKEDDLHRSVAIANLTKTSNSKFNYQQP